MSSWAWHPASCPLCCRLPAGLYPGKWCSLRSTARRSGSFSVSAVVIQARSSSSSSTAPLSRDASSAWRSSHTHRFRSSSSKASSQDSSCGTAPASTLLRSRSRSPGWQGLLTVACWWVGRAVLPQTVLWYEGRSRGRRPGRPRVGSFCGQGVPEPCRRRPEVVSQGQPGRTVRPHPPQR